MKSRDPETKHQELVDWMAVDLPYRPLESPWLVNIPDGEGETVVFIQSIMILQPI